MSEPARKRATYADVLAAPEHKVAEVIDGVLYTQPRPRVRHAFAHSKLGSILGSGIPDDDGPEGWLFLVEPELHFARPEPLGEVDILVPDIAAWRRSRMQRAPLEAAYITLAPDWVCEVISPSTEVLDRAEKMPVYAREGVQHAWLVNAEEQLLEVFELDRGRWTVAQVVHGDAEVQAPPFDSFALKLSKLWAG
jgi:Uma2 family endonuclease